MFALIVLLPCPFATSSPISGLLTGVPTLAAEVDFQTEIRRRWRPPLKGFRLTVHANSLSLSLARAALIRWVIAAVAQPGSESECWRLRLTARGADHSLWAFADGRSPRSSLETANKVDEPTKRFQGENAFGRGLYAEHRLPEYVLALGAARYGQSPTDAFA